MLVWSGGSLDDLAHLMSHGSGDQMSDEVARNNASHTSVWFGEYCEPSRAEEAPWPVPIENTTQSGLRCSIVIPDGSPTAPLRDDRKTTTEFVGVQLETCRRHMVQEFWWNGVPWHWWSAVHVRQLV